MSILFCIYQLVSRKLSYVEVRLRGLMIYRTGLWV